VQQSTSQPKASPAEPGQALPTQAIVFDMDGLMIDTEIIYHRAWQRAATELGYTIDDALFAGLIGVRTDECEAAIRDHLGADFPLATFQERWMARWEELAESQGIARKPGLTELLGTIVGLPKAVATSSTMAEAERSLRLSDLARHFDIVVTGDQVAHGKPAPDIFAEAARRLGIPADACIAFEDSNAGALAAHRAGMRVYVVPDLVPPNETTRAVATDILATLHDAQRLFAAGE
jgi:HAD superfamily hydrolase (TIGR01509 family)